MAIACSASIGPPLLPAAVRHARATGRRAWDASSCCYLPDLLPRSYFQKVLAHYRDLRQDLSEEGPCLATGRLAVTCTSGAAWRIFRSSWFRQRLQRVAGLPFRPGKMGKDSQSLGMEFREYRQNSSMLWHSDQILLDPPQLELVYTLENSSDSVTRWSPSHLHVLRNEIQQVWTAPNSGLLLQVQEDEHESLEEMIEERVYEEDTEFFVMQSFPTFTLIQCTLILMSYILLSATSGKSLAGLETWFPGQTDLALTNVQSEGSCQDFRFQLWRALTYQFTHSSFTHMLGNVLLLAMCGINLEGFHGTLRLLWMFEIGVLGGAGCVCVFDSHARVVGMSGGAYALLGMQLGDVLLNWERKSAPYRLIFIFLLALTEVMLYLFNPREEISYSAHMGGGVAGLLLVLVFGRNLTIKTYDLERQVIRVAKVLLFGFATFCICWALINWPPMDLIEQVPYCWAREVSNQTIFGDGTFHCVRCSESDCIAGWSPPLQNDSVPVNPRSCDSWAVSET